MTGGDNYYPIDPSGLLGCARLGHSWDDQGDCRHCPANQDDNLPGDASGTGSEGLPHRSHGPATCTEHGLPVHAQDESHDYRHA